MQINGFGRDEAVKHPLVIALSVVVFAECAVLAVATIYLVIEILTGASGSLPSAIALTVLTAVAATWLGFIALNIRRGRAWVRGATITWQVFQVVIAVGCLQGLFASPTVGWALLAAAFVAAVLLFTRPVVAATAEREPPGQS
jgi:hypothetical protein